MKQTYSPIWRTRFFWRTGSAFSIRLPGGWLGVELCVPALYWTGKPFRILWTTRAFRKQLAADGL